MLTPELIVARRRGGDLVLAKMDKKRLCAIEELAEALIDVAQRTIGEPRDTVGRELDAICETSPDRKLALAVKKIVLDGCTFDETGDSRALELRQAVFRRAARTWQSLSDSDPFNRAGVLEVVARSSELDAGELERSLFSDLPGAQPLLSAKHDAPATIARRFPMLQVQGALIRATRVRMRLETDRPAPLRRLIHAMKFRRLLFRITKLEEKACELELEGPLSLFGPSTKYGLELALAFGTVAKSARYTLEADLAWGKSRSKLKLHARGEPESDPAPATPELRPELEKLVSDFERRESKWTVRRRSKLVELAPGEIVATDLGFEHPDGTRVELELLGYWSRDAVFRRIELAERHAAAKIVFCASERLRVSERLLAPESQAALVMFKGALSARAVHERLERLRRG